GGNRRARAGELRGARAAGMGSWAGAPGPHRPHAEPLGDDEMADAAARLAVDRARRAGREEPGEELPAMLALLGVRDDRVVALGGGGRLEDLLKLGGGRGLHSGKMIPWGRGPGLSDIFLRRGRVARPPQ